MYQEEFEQLVDLFYKASLSNQNIFLGWKPVNYTHPSDMSAQQKTLGFVGAAKVKGWFCHVCTCHSKNIATPNEGDAVCEECQAKKVDNPTWECYCHPFASVEQTKRYEKVLEEMTQQNQVDLEKVHKEGKLKLIYSKTNPSSITYKPESFQECYAF